METFETRRTVPEVSAEAAEALGRPANAHTVVEVWEVYAVTPDPMGFLAHRSSFTQKRRVSQRREGLQPLKGAATSVVFG
jgi:hypothetical protein